MRVEEELPEAQNLELSSPHFGAVVAWESRKTNVSPRVVGMCHMFVVEDIDHSSRTFVEASGDHLDKARCVCLCRRFDRCMAMLLSDSWVVVKRRMILAP